MGYTTRAVKGVSWVWGLNLTNKLISLFRTIVLARLLTPSEFGIYGIGLLALSMLEVFTETGVNVFLVQQKEDLKKWINSAWVVSIARGIVISSILFLSSGLVSDFFHSKNAKDILIVLSIAPLIRGLINPSEVRFQRDLTFGKEFFYRSIIFIFDSIVSITLAYYTHLAISLAVGVIAGSILQLALSFILIKPRPIFRLEKKYITTIFFHGKWVTLAGIFNYLYHNLDNIVIGRLLGVGSLGLYEMAYNISRIPITGISDVASKVTFPVYSLISEDKDRLRKAFIKSISVVSIVSFIFGFILFFFSEPLVKLILGEKWIGIVGVLKILAIFGVLRSISGFTSSLFLGIKKQKYVSIVTFASVFLLAVTIIPLVKNYGLEGAGYSVLISSILTLPLFVYFSYKSLK